MALPCITGSVSAAVDWGGGRRVGDLELPARRTLVLGHFGSGKTEVAIQLAVAEAHTGRRPLLVDLDFITPYFRARDAAGYLGRRGVELIAPDGALRHSDLPVITGRAVQALTGYDGPVVADVGGDEGVRVVSSLASHLGSAYAALMVVNPYRPGTDDPERIAAYARWLAEAGRITFSGLVSNPHLGIQTTPATVRDGHRVVMAAAARLALPVVRVAARADLVPELDELDPLPLELAMKLPWEVEAV